MVTKIFIQDLFLGGGGGGGGGLGILSKVLFPSPV